MLGMCTRNLLSRVSAMRRAISTTLPTSYPIVIRMPALSPTMTEGTIVSWVKNEGEEVLAGDSLCEIQTDKAVMTMDTEEEGVLAKILKADGSSMVPVGQPIAVIAEEGEDWQSMSVADLDLDAEEAPADSQKRQSRDSEFPPLNDLVSLKIGPAVRLLLKLYRLDPNDIELEGPNRRLLKGDVLEHIAANDLKPQPPEAAPPPAVSAESAPPVVKTQPKPASPHASRPPPSAPLTDVPFKDVTPSPTEAAAALRVSNSKRDIPHNYVSLEVTLDHAMEVADRAKLPVGPFILKAAAVALYAVPEANSFLKSDGVSVEAHPVVDIAVVTSIHRNSSPCILRGVDRMTCADIADQLSKPVPNSDNVSTATFTVIDLTDSSVAHLAAVVSPPQAATLAVGGISSVLSAVPGAPQLQRKATATLSVDIRVLDEALAAKFLSAFASALEMAVVAVPGVNLQKDAMDDILGLGLD